VIPAGPGKAIAAGPGLTAYARALSTPPDAVEASLVARTGELGGPAMMLSTADQTRLLSLLVATLGARDVLELGTFTGRATLAMARALPADGRLITCDLSRRWTAIAREHWRRAGVDGRIDLHLRPGLELLRTLPERPSFDLAFIDADKGGYVPYYEEILPRLRPGGLVVADNVLADGRVLDHPEPGTVAFAMDRFNRHVAADPRVEVVVLTVADGVSVARKRPDPGGDVR
jgi:caffeoyl-CoA O-methyltransferase